MEPLAQPSHRACIHGRYVGWYRLEGSQAAGLTNFTCLAILVPGLLSAKAGGSLAFAVRCRVNASAAAGAVAGLAVC